MKSERKKRWWIPVVIVVVVLLVVAEIGFMVIPGMLGEGTPKGYVRASGRIEGRVLEVSPKIGGRVVEILIEEGETVSAGQLVARLSSEQIEARRREVKANLDLWRNRKGQAEVDLRITNVQVETNIRSAEQRLEAAKAEVRRLEKAAEKAKKDYDRSADLLSQGAIPKTRLEEAELALKSAQEQLEVARKLRGQAELALQLAKDMRLTLELKRSAIDNAEKAVQAAQASLDEVDSLLEDTKLYAPINGVVLQRVVEPHEVIAAGTPIVTLVNPDDLFLKVYLPNADVGKLKLGDEAQIIPDAFPEEQFEAEVIRIGDRALFTPKNVETAEQRVNLVFEVKLGKIDNHDRRLKPGMPAEALIRIDE